MRLSYMPKTRNPAFALFVRAAEAFMVQPPGSLPSSGIRSAMFIEQ
jgi:hypothetical protein